MTRSPHDFSVLVILFYRHVSDMQGRILYISPHMHLLNESVTMSVQYDICRLHLEPHVIKERKLTANLWWAVLSNLIVQFQGLLLRVRQKPSAPAVLDALA